MSSVSRMRMRALKRPTFRVRVGGRVWVRVRLRVRDRVGVRVRVRG